MNLLEYGLENKESSSAVRRRLARIALELERVRADLLERKLRSHKYDYPAGDDNVLWEKIMQQINSEEK